MRDRIATLVQSAAEELSATLEHRISSDPQAPLFGRGGPLDSIALVSLVVAIEQSIADAFGVTVSLANEKAMSQDKSPFRSLARLTDWAELCVNEAQGHGS